MSEPVQILGAGLTGMSAAYHLGDGCAVVEKKAQPGGKVVTLKENGFRFDRTGHLLHLRDPEIRAWIEPLLGEGVVEVDRKSRIFTHGVYTRYPFQANTYGLPAEIAYDCLRGFIEAQVSTSDHGEPKTFEEFCLRHFGEGFSRHFMIPYNLKLWGVHPREITAEWCSRFVPLPSLDDVIAGAVGLNDRELGYNARFLYPKEGIGQLTSALSEELGDRIRCLRAPSAIDWRARKLVFEDDEESYQVLLSTAPLDTLLGLLVDPPKEIAGAGRDLRCSSLWYLDVALGRPCGVEYHWVYVPEERFPFYRVGCYSNFSSLMAPVGKAALYVELASREQPDLEAIMPSVSEGLIEMGIIDRAADIEFARLRHIHHAYVVFDHSYYGALQEIFPFLEEQRIISCGRYGGWNYSSMEDALIFGREAATKARQMMD